MRFRVRTPGPGLRPFVFLEVESGDELVLQVLLDEEDAAVGVTRLLEVGEEEWCQGYVVLPSGSLWIPRRHCAELAAQLGAALLDLQLVREQEARAA